MKNKLPADNKGAENSPQQTSACDNTPQRPVRYEVEPQRGGARVRVRYREGSNTSDGCRLCR